MDPDYRDAPLDATTRPGRWVLPEGEGRRIAQLTFCRSENVGKSCYFNDLQRLWPAAWIDVALAQGVARQDRPFRSPNGASAFASVFRRCVNMLANHPLENTLVERRETGEAGTRAGSRPIARRAAVETRPPGGRSRRVTSARHWTSTLMHAVFAGARLRRHSIGHLPLKHERRVLEQPLLVAVAAA